MNLKYMENDQQSPGPGDQSRMTDKSRMSLNSYYHQTVTQISFNPGHSLSLIMTGTDAHLDYRKVLVGCDPPLEPQVNPVMNEMAELVRGETIACHAWSPDGSYFGICTEHGRVLVYKLGSDIVFDHQFECDDDNDRAHFVSVQLFEYAMNVNDTIDMNVGIVVASSDGSLYFWENSDQNDYFSCIREWKYSIEDKLNSVDVIRGIQVLDQGPSSLDVNS